MARPKKENSTAEPKRRSRTGCWPCKARKVKCGEERPQCLNCQRQGETCDYSIRLNWGGRAKKGDGFVDMNPPTDTSSSSIIFPSPEAFTGQPSPSPTRSTFSNNDASSRPGRAVHSRSRSNLSLPPLAPHMHEANTADERTSPSIPTGQISHSPDAPASHPRSPLIDPEMQVQHPARNQPLFQASRYGPEYISGPLRDLNGRHSQTMLPPYRSDPTSIPPQYRDVQTEGSVQSDAHRSKRLRMSAQDLGMQLPSIHLDSSRGMLTPLPSTMDPKSSNMPTHVMQGSYNQAVPLTPGSSVASDEQLRASVHLAPTLAAPPPDIRRLSVSSLLVDNTGGGNTRRSASADEQIGHEHGHSHAILDCVTEHTCMYGYDWGQPDNDMNNDDEMAIIPATPNLSRGSSSNNIQVCAGGHIVTEDEIASRARDMAFEPGGYYARPVPIKIPQSLEPLPQNLLENKMNLLYFHHFLNHTARILAPHDCEQNPFRSILPEMAIDDPDLLSLLLAYSASHRSRLLGHKPPFSRIATYVSGVLPKLRHAIESSEPVSLKSLATAITLASLEILSPSDAISLPWRTHLHVVRKMVSARGGPLSAHRNDKFAYFLSRWFAYLDVLGSLSGGANDRPPNQAYWAQEGDIEVDNQIDCLLGFTRRCASILSRVSDIIKHCETLGRINQSTRQVNASWTPPAAIQQEAEHLIAELRRGREARYQPCAHRTLSENTNEAMLDAHEILATNEMYHWAGIIHLSTRVLNLDPADANVQQAGRKIVEGLYKVRHGSTAEACLLFPMFTAGCIAVGQVQRDRIMSRLRSVENFGMMHVTKARKLMERVWSEGISWETLVTDEFMG